MQPKSPTDLSVQDCVKGMERLRKLSEPGSENASGESLDETAVAELSHLLDAVTRRDQWSDDDFDRIFLEDVDPVPIGFEVAGLICRSTSISGLPMVLKFFHWMVAEGDEEWLFADGPEIMSDGSAAMAVALVDYVGDATEADDVKSCIVDGLEELTQSDPSVAQAIRPHVVAALKSSQQLTVRATTGLMRLAVELKFAEAAEAIETAFSENRIDCGMMGNWEIVRREMHVRGHGLPMPEKPHNSMDDFRRNVGVGCFSKEPIFLAGEIREDAVEKYLETACSAFAQSEESRQVLNDGAEPHYVRQFLEFGVHYLGVSTETMTIADATELLRTVFPRKVSIDASKCDNVIRELVAFWKFCDRVYQLESASAIASEIATLADRFRQAMSDPANFGMAKSFFTQGQQAGFDMTTQEGMSEFALAYNASRTQLPGGERTSDRRIDAGTESPQREPIDRKQRKKLLAKKKKGAKRTNK